MYESSTLSEEMFWQFKYQVKSKVAFNELQVIILVVAKTKQWLHRLLNKWFNKIVLVYLDYWVDTNYRYELILGMSKDYQINSVQRFVDYALGEKPYSLSLFQLAEKFHLKLTSNKCCEYLSKSQVAKDFSGLSTSGISSDARLKILTAKLNACFNQQCSRCHNKATCTHLKPMEVKGPDQAIILALLNQWIAKELYCF